MTPKRQRLILGVLAAAAVTGAGLIAASALREEASYFRTPAEVAGGAGRPGEDFRLGGMVERGSLRQLADGVSIAFVATDGTARVPVTYTGIVPDLFVEGSGMVADGRMAPDRSFVAKRILAKHDERYMPPQLNEGPGAIRRDTARTLAEPT